MQYEKREIVKRMWAVQGGGAYIHTHTHTGNRLKCSIERDKKPMETMKKEQHIQFFLQFE